MLIRPLNRFPFALLAGLGLLVATAAHSGAAVLYSGVVDIPIPPTLAGTYLNIGTGGTTEPTNDPDGVAVDSYTVGYSEPATWDVNFFLGGVGIAYSPTFQPFVDDTVGSRSQILNVAADTVISTEAGSRTLAVDVVDDVYGGSGRSNGSPGSSHFDTPTVDLNPAYSAFTPGAQGYIAFVLNPGAGEQYGWMRVTLTNDGTSGTIHEWAYSDELNFEVGQIPEPSTLALLGGLAALGFIAPPELGKASDHLPKAFGLR